jgi:hypothetical protein
MRFVFQLHTSVIREVKAIRKQLELKCHANVTEVCMPCVGYW